MSDHLGDRAAALVDGELGDHARDRALVHLAHCLDCRGEVEEQRRLKNALQLEVPAPLAERMSALLREAGPPPGSGPLAPPRPLPAATPAVRAAWSTAVDQLPAASRYQRPVDSPLLVRPVPQRWRGPRIAATCTLAAGLAVAAVASLGGGPEARQGPRLPSVDPASRVYLDQHAATSSGVGPDAPVVTAVLARLGR